MNPVQMIMGQGSPIGMAGNQMGGGPMGMMQNIMQRAQQLAGTFQNPQQMIQQYIPNAPADVRNDPEQLVNWMQQSGMVTPQMVQMARQMMGGR